MWLAAVLSSDADRSVTASDNVTKHYEKGSSAYLAPELLLSSATDITTKVFYCFFFIQTCSPHAAVTRERTCCL